jgi:hypothetical protein
MRFLRKEEQNGKAVLVAEQSLFIFFKKEVKYIADSVQIPNKYWSWRRLPNFDLVYDGISFKLDSWMRNHK